MFLFSQSGKSYSVAFNQPMLPSSQASAGQPLPRGLPKAPHEAISNPQSCKLENSAPPQVFQGPATPRSNFQSQPSMHQYILK